MTEYSENRTVINTENGQPKYEFTTPLVEGYTAGKDPYREFRKGVKIITYKADSAGVADVTLTANYAIYYENRKLWEAKGDVVVEKSDGKKLYTEQLFWNAITRKIYSNVDSKIVQPDGEFFVSSFESDEEFRYWGSRDMDGHMEVEFKPTEPADSLRADSAAVRPNGPAQRSDARAKAQRGETRHKAPVKQNALAKQNALVKQNAFVKQNAQAKLNTTAKHNAPKVRMPGDGNSVSAARPAAGSRLNEKRQQIKLPQSRLKDQKPNSAAAGSATAAGPAAAAGSTTTENGKR